MSEQPESTETPKLAESTETPKLPIIVVTKNKKSKIHFYISVLIIFAIASGLVYSIKGLVERYKQYDEAYKKVGDSVQQNVQLKAKVISLNNEFQKNCENEKDFDLDNPLRPSKIKLCVGELRDIYFVLLNNTSKSDEVLLNVGYAIEDRLDYLVLRNLARNKTFDYLVSKSAIKSKGFDPSPFFRENDPSGSKYGEYLKNQLSNAQKKLNAIDPTDVLIPIILEPKK